jgi:hypothetical protein
MGAHVARRFDLPPKDDHSAERTELRFTNMSKTWNGSRDHLFADNILGVIGAVAVNPQAAPVSKPSRLLASER